MHNEREDKSIRDSNLQSTLISEPFSFCRVYIIELCIRNLLLGANLCRIITAINQLQLSENLLRVRAQVMHINNKYNAKLTFRRQSVTAWRSWQALCHVPQTAARTRPKTNTASAIALFHFRLFFMSCIPSESRWVGVYWGLANTYRIFKFQHNNARNKCFMISSRFCVHVEIY